MADKALQRVWIPGQDKPAWFPADMSQVEIERAVRSHLGVPEAKPATGPPDSIEPAPGTPEAMTAMVGRLLTPIDKSKEPISVGGVTPSSVGNALLPPLLMAPTIGAGGEAMTAVSALGKAAPAAGRALTAGAIGGAQALSSGAGVLQAGKQALIDALLGLGLEGLSALPTRVKIPFTDLPTLKDVGEKIPRAKAGFEAGTKAIREAFDAIKDRLPKGKWMNVPTLGAKKITAEEAIEKLLAQRGADYKQALGEVVSEFNRLDIQHGVRGFRGPAPYAGAAFKGRAPEAHFVYKGTPGERAATKTLDAMRSPATRSVIQAEMEPEVVPGIPRGAIPAIEASERLGFDALSRAVRR